ncbi:MAG TPA: hypothetical protein VIR56_07650 [Solimonas sp.]
MSFTALSLYVIAPAFAADPHDCIAVNGDAQRLACYDAALGRSGAASADAATPPPAAATTAAHDFGAEQLPRSAKDKSKAPDTIQAHIKGNFEGWEPKTRFALDNGQIWQVVDDHSAYYRPAMNSQVTLEKGMFGAYYLRIDGLNARVKVKRIR